MDGAVALGTFVNMLCKGTPPFPPHLIMIKIMNNYFSSNGQTFGPNFLSETLTFYRILKCLTYSQGKLNSVQQFVKIGRLYTIYTV